jgi:oxygen-independent coproporphyrinogen-3 oxidase
MPLAPMRIVGPRPPAEPPAGCTAEAALHSLSWPGGVALDSALLDAAAPAVAGSASLAYRQALLQLAAQPAQAVAVAVVVPFCAARCLCCQRPVHIAQPAPVIDAYVSALVDEFDAVARLAGAGRDLLQLHLGAGTANELGESQLARLLVGLQRHWRLPADAEVSAECDPRQVGEFQLRVLRGLGVRHLTFGVLELDETVQRTIGRVHSAALISDVCDLARAAGIDSINLELMVGLPHQTPSGWQATLQKVMAMAPDRITVLRYRHRPALVPAQRALSRQDLPSADEVHGLAGEAASTLCEAGYRWIGAELFVLEGDELSMALDESRLRRNLIGYTATAAAPQLGFGAGAVSDIDGSLFWNAPGLPAWHAALQHGELAVVLAQPDDGPAALRRAAVEQLLCRQELSAAQAAGGLKPAYSRLAQHAAAGLVQVLDDRIVVTALGRQRLAALCSEFGAVAAAVPQGVTRWMS